MRQLITYFAISLFAFSCQKNGGAPPGKAPQGQPEEGAPKVSVFKAQKQKIPVSSKLPGRVRAYSVAQIRPQVTGIILERLFKEGSNVKKGQQLYQIDPARYQAAYEMARARLMSAKASLSSSKALFGRYTQLVKQNAISKQEYDDAKANYNKALADVALAKAEVKNTKIDLEYTKVFSPIDGFIGKSSVTKGALVNAAQSEPLAVVRQLDPVYVDLSQPSAEAFRLKRRLGKYILSDRGAVEVELQLGDEGKSYEHKGKLEVKELSVNEASASVEMRAVFPNPETALLPGMFVRAYVKEIGMNDMALVPQKALQRDQSGNAFVWIVKKDNTLEKRQVSTGSMFNQSWTIESGLEEGEKVATNNLSMLAAGMKVEPAPMEKPKKARLGE